MSAQLRIFGPEDVVVGFCEGDEFHDIGTLDSLGAAIKLVHYLNGGEIDSDIERLLAQMA